MRVSFIDKSLEENIRELTESQPLAVKFENVAEQEIFQKAISTDISRLIHMDNHWIIRSYISVDIKFTDTTRLEQYAGECGYKFITAQQLLNNYEMTISKHYTI